MAVIPARIGASRLPRKPLVKLAGRPLIEWVWRRVVATQLFDQVVIATDSAEVAEATRHLGAAVELTRPDHPSGTDRVAEVLTHPAYAGFDVVVNVQGDEPFITRDALRAASGLVRGGAWQVGTVATQLQGAEEWRSAAVVKVVRGANGAALFFTRAPVPHVRDGEPTDDTIRDGPFLRHLGVYAYRRDALERWVTLPPSPLERLEQLEQLRPLEAGISIGVEETAAPLYGGIDTPEDARRAEPLIAATLLPEV